MKLKTVGLSISLAAAGWLGISEAASAAKFAPNDTLSINIPTFQINAAGGFGYPDLPTGEVSGGADGLADALFGTNFPPISVDNRVINKNGGDVVPGVKGEFSVGSSSGGFIPYQGTEGLITSFDGTEFDELTEVNGGFNADVAPNNPTNPSDVPSDLFNDNFLLKLDDGPGDVYFYLNDVEGIDLAGILAGDPIFFSGTGWVAAVGDHADVAYYKARYEITSQSLPDDGQISGDPVAGDGVTGVTTLSGTSIVVTIIPPPPPPQENVPEPSTIFGLSALAGMGLLMKKNKLRASK